MAVPAVPVAPALLQPIHNISFWIIYFEQLPDILIINLLISLQLYMYVKGNAWFVDNIILIQK